MIKMCFSPNAYSRLLRTFMTSGCFFPLTWDTFNSAEMGVSITGSTTAVVM